MNTLPSNLHIHDWPFLALSSLFPPPQSTLIPPFPCFWSVTSTSQNKLHKIFSVLSLFYLHPTVSSIPWHALTPTHLGLLGENLFPWPTSPLSINGPRKADHCALSSLITFLAFSSLMLLFLWFLQSSCFSHSLTASQWMLFHIKHFWIRAFPNRVLLLSVLVWYSVLASFLSLWKAVRYKYLTKSKHTMSIEMHS